MTYYVYILRCEGGALYTGITTDPDRRMAEHFGATPQCAKFTRAHRPQALVALWRTEGRDRASRLEFKLKRLTHREKLSLIARPDRLALLLPPPFAAEQYAPAPIPEKWTSLFSDRD